ncbi:MAG: DUF721 domain-containing protein [Mariniblastus sp.]|nr:DUF721 domain-containing protein [Mariniblastus sp.]
MKPDDDYSELDFENAKDQVERRRVYRRRLKTASGVMGQVMAHRGIAQQQATSELSETWSQIVGVSFAGHTRLGSLKRGVLEIHVANSMISQQLSFKKQKILQQLQEQLPNNKIRDMRFRIGSTG